MATKTKIAMAITSVDVTPITSLTDLGYRQGATRDALRNQAQYAIDKIVGFPEEIDDTSKAIIWTSTTWIKTRRLRLKNASRLVLMWSFPTLNKSTAN